MVFTIFCLELKNCTFYKAFNKIGCFSVIFLFVCLFVCLFERMFFSVFGSFDPIFNVISNISVDFFKYSNFKRN